MAAELKDAILLSNMAAKTTTYCSFSVGIFLITLPEDE